MLNEFYVKLIEAETWFFGQLILNEPLMQLVILFLNCYLLVVLFGLTFFTPLYFIWRGICKWLGWDRDVWDD